jgi:hypothetical protein
LLALEEGMGRVIVVMKPTSGKNALSDVIMGVSIVNRDGGGADGGGEGKEDDESTSEGGQHDASRGGARKGAMKGEDDLLSVGHKTSVSCNFRNRTYRSQSGTPHFIFPFPSRLRLALARRHHHVATKVTIRELLGSNAAIETMGYYSTISNIENIESRQVRPH